MIIQLREDDVNTWFVCFGYEATPALDRWIPGKFKHVRAFGFSHGAQCWVFYDHLWIGTRIALAPAGPVGDRAVGRFVEDQAVLKLSRLTRPRGGIRHRLGFTCVTTARQLLNVPGGALAPDGFWRDCLKAGAEFILDGRRKSTAGDPGPEPCSANAAGAGD